MILSIKVIWSWFKVHERTYRVICKYCGILCKGPQHLQTVVSFGCPRTKSLGTLRKDYIYVRKLNTVVHT